MKEELSDSLGKSVGSKPVEQCNEHRRGIILVFLTCRRITLTYISYQKQRLFSMQFCEIIHKSRSFGNSVKLLPKERPSNLFLIDLGIFIFLFSSGAKS